MASVAEIKPSVTRLSATDPNLAFLASRAAIELDRISQGITNFGLSAVTELGELLKTSTCAVSGAPEPLGLWDPTTISLIHNAIKAGGSSKVITLAELAAEAENVAKGLVDTVDDSNDSRVQRLRAFCVGLANSAVAYEREQLESNLEKASWS